MSSLQDKNIVLGVCGGIAAYKAPDLVRRLQDVGASVRVVMTHGAKAFVTPLTFQAVSGYPVQSEVLDEDSETIMSHIALAKWADLILVAPATADTIAKIAHGLSGDLLTTLILASEAKLAVAPAMNQQMFKAMATQENIAKLVSRHVSILGPAQGEQACGDVGPGRMLEPLEIVALTAGLFANQRMAGKKVVITAGPTREAIDPVRYISNHSSGKMGFALAQAAKNMGADVTLVSGPVNLQTPLGCNRIDVDSANDMLNSVMDHIQGADLFIGCAAVADYRPSYIADDKIKKHDDTMSIQLIKNPDILQQVASLEQGPVTLGFAAETQNVEEYAKAKLSKKGLDMIAANDVSKSDRGFNQEQNALEVFWTGGHKSLPLASKQEIALSLLETVCDQCF